ncbi:MAG: N-acetylmuramoyl-L-alanine amidase [Spirosomaceae bacterium]|nr:N-acetylmuramoyl-L-alanine amidase [Spirosomataceae bacterium]
MLIFSGWYTSVTAQAPLSDVSKEHLIDYYNYRVTSNQWIALSSPTLVSSIALESDNVLVGAVAVCESDTFEFRQDAHITEKAVSNLWVLAKPSHQIRIFTGQNQGNLTVVALHVPAVQVIAPRPSALRVAYCEGQKPTVVPVSTWRTGLPAPKELPSATQVRHLVVHHSAGSNSSTNYTDVVRNIYVFHTQSNGWNDVGYNFLIAQDGTIFEGRDGQGRMEGDNVLGAHFCAKNTATMGVCLLGNYQMVQPSDASIRALLQLLSWKLKKENLDVLTTEPHPPTAPQGNLSTLVGHRDGCATDCPGNNVYARLNEFRMSLAACGYTKPLATSPNSDTFRLLVKESEWEINSIYTIESILVNDLVGKNRQLPLIERQDNIIRLDTRSLSSGLYFLRGTTQQGERFTYKIMVP